MQMRSSDFCLVTTLFSSPPHPKKERAKLEVTLSERSTDRDKFLRGCNIQGLAKAQAPGFVNFVPDVSYYFSIDLPEAFTQPWARGNEF